MTRIDVRATEGGTLVLLCSFADEEGNPVTPASNVVWKLMDRDWTQISTGSVVAASPNVTIVIKGDDLKSNNSVNDYDVLLCKISTTYDSTIGLDVPLVKMVEIPIDNTRD